MKTLHALLGALLFAVLAALPAPAIAMKVGLAQCTLPTSVTTVNCTDSNAGFSSDVKVAICSLTSATANNTKTANAKFSVGVAVNDGSSTQFAEGSATQDAVATTNAGSQYFNSTNIYTIGTTSSTPASDGEGQVSAWLSNGITLSVVDADAALLVNCLLLGGSDIEASVKTGQYPGLGSNNDLALAHGLGGAPDFAVLVGAETTTTDTESRTHIGFWGRTTPSEAGVSYNNANGVSGALLTIDVDNAKAIPLITSSVTADVQTVDGTNFTVRGTNSDTNYMTALFVRGTTSGQIEARTSNFLSHTGTGSNNDITGFTLPVQAGLLIGTKITSVTFATDDMACCFSFGMFVNAGGSTIEQGSTNISGDDAAATTIEKSQTSNTEALRILDTNGDADVEAAVTSFGTSVAFNTTNAGASGYEVFYLAFALPTGNTIPSRPLSGAAFGGPFNRGPGP